MDPYNIAICFGPNLCPIPEGKDLVQHTNLVNDLIKNFITFCKDIFNFVAYVNAEWVLSHQLLFLWLFIHLVLGISMMKRLEKRTKRKLKVRIMQMTNLKVVSETYFRNLIPTAWRSSCAVWIQSWDWQGTQF